MRSITDPDIIDAVVAANNVNAPQKTPDALSAIFGPIYSTHGRAIALAYANPDIAFGPSLNVIPVGKAQ